MTTAATLAALPEAERLKLLGGLSAKQLEALQHEWRFWARPDQLQPTIDHRIWCIKSGRGWGKTRVGSETVRAEIEAGRRRRVVVLSPTAATLRRDVVEGPSGLLATASPWFMPTHEPSSLKMTYPDGARIDFVSSETPDRLRGGNWDFAWVDEFAAFYQPQETLDMLLFALRLTGPKGDAPRLIITTTPRPIPALKKLLAMPGVIVTNGHTEDNAANLDPAALALMKARYENTRLGRQELAGELLTDTPGAMWTQQQIEACTIQRLPTELKRIVVGVDPAGGASKQSDETGIVACGLGKDGRGYVLGDASGRFTPDGWARAAVGLYRSWSADRIVAERNFGGDMVENTLRSIDPFVPVKMVTATRGKQLRAEPVAALYEQKRIFHVGSFQALEDQMTGWAPQEAGPSPDRVDALVWCLTELMVEPQAQPARGIRINIFGR